MRNFIIVIICLCSVVSFYCQEIDFHQYKTQSTDKDKAFIDSVYNNRVFKNKSLVVDLFAFSNFERLTYKFAANDKIDFKFNLPFGCQLEYFLKKGLGIGILSRFSKFSYTRRSFDSMLGTEYNQQVTTTNFNNLFVIYFHPAINSKKSDLSIGIGAGLSSRFYERIESTGISWNSKNQSGIGGLRIQYRSLIFSNFGISFSLGADIDGSATPFTSLGLTYKIL
jgi:hypothetical protein